jgi:hypothetical protein
LSGIGVVSLKGEGVAFHDVLETMVHKATVATLVVVRSTLGAVDQLLLGVVLEVVTFDGEDTFDGAGGGESPA